MEVCGCVEPEEKDPIKYNNTYLERFQRFKKAGGLSTVDVQGVRDLLDKSGVTQERRVADSSVTLVLRHLRGRLDLIYMNRVHPKCCAHSTVPGTLMCVYSMVWMWQLEAAGTAAGTASFVIAGAAASAVVAAFEMPSYTHAPHHWQNQQSKRDITVLSGSKLCIKLMHLF